MDNSSVPRSFQCPPSNSSTSSDQDIQKLDPVTVLNIHKSLLQSRDQLWANQRDGHTVSLLQHCFLTLYHTMTTFNAF